MDHPQTRPDAPSVTALPAAMPPLPAQRRPDPGSRGAARLAGLLAAMLIVAVSILQHTEGSSAIKGEEKPSEQFAPAPFNLEIPARVAVKINAASPNPMLAESILPGLDDIADRPEQKVRVAIVAAELAGAEAGLSRLETVRKELPDDSPLAPDVDALAALYRAPSEGEPAPALDAPIVERLEKNHGWFGRLAAAYGKPATDPVRLEVVGGGAALLVAIATIVVVAVTAFLTGLVLLIVGIVKAINGRLHWRFVPPAPGGSVAIETVAVFLAGFFLLKMTTEVVGAAAGGTVSLVYVLTAQWVLVLALLWPVFQGVPRREGLALLGLHRGRGVLREIGCGIVGYLACLPILVIGIVVTVLLLLVQEAVSMWLTKEKPPPLENPIIDLVGGGGNSWVVVLLFLLASLWAPLVEEAIFRGALYRHFRSRWRVAPAAVVTALAFGLMHGYPLLALGPVISIGFGFAVLREWRGSIIASMTGHCLHNASVLTMLLVVTRLLGM